MRSGTETTTKVRNKPARATTTVSVPPDGPGPNPLPISPGSVPVGKSSFLKSFRPQNEANNN